MKFTDIKCPWCSGKLSLNAGSGLYSGCDNKACVEMPRIHDPVGVGNDELIEMWEIRISRRFNKLKSNDQDNQR